MWTEANTGKSSPPADMQLLCPFFATFQASCACTSQTTPDGVWSEPDTESVASRSHIFIMSK